MPRDVRGGGFTPGRWRDDVVEGIDPAEPSNDPMAEALRAAKYFYNPEVSMSPKNPAPHPSRERILEAAVNRFMRHGYAGTSLSSIADKAGVSTPALYWHFSGKDEIYYAAMEQVLQGFIDYVELATDAGEPAGRLAQIVTAHVTWQLEQADMASAYAASIGMRFLIAHLPRESREKIVGIQREYLQMLKALLSEGNAQGVFQVRDESITAFAIMTMCEYVYTWYRPEGPLSVPEVAQRIVKLSLRAVGATTNP